MVPRRSSEGCMTYQQFRVAVELRTLTLVGVSTADLPDFDFRGAYEDDMTVDETVADMLAAAGWSDPMLGGDCLPPALRPPRVEGKCTCHRCEAARSAEGC